VSETNYRLGEGGGGTNLARNVVNVFDGERLLSEVVYLSHFNRVAIVCSAELKHAFHYCTFFSVVPRAVQNDIERNTSQR
jgi:hypothetical protein